MRISHTLMRAFAKKHVYLSLSAAAGLAVLLYGPSAGWAQMLLGSAQSFGVLGSSTVTNTGPSTVNGNVGVSTVGGITGFPPGVVTGGTIHNNDAVATTAQGDVTTAYNTLAARPCTASFGPGDQDLTLLSPLPPGVYCFASTASLSGALVLDAQGNPNAEFTFKIGSALTTAPGSSVTVIHGGSTCNVFWQIVSSATLDTDTRFVGNILALASITLNTRAQIVSGRALARTAKVSMDTNHIDSKACLVANASTCTSGFDCSSGNCSGGTCAVCMSGADCTSGSCVSSTCCIPSGSACGGDCPVQCANGETCSIGSDCASGFCDVNNMCAACITAVTDCANNLCVNGVCTVPPILQIKKTPNTSSVAPGATLIYTLSYRNLGGTTATSVMITETVPAHTTFNAAASTSGWSCPDGSPPATVCTLSVPNVAPGGKGAVLFAVSVDNPASTTVIQNSVTIASAEGPGGSGTATTRVVRLAPAPMLGIWGFAALVALLTGIAWVGLRRAQET